MEMVVLLLLEIIVLGDWWINSKNFTSALKTKLDNISDNDVIDWTR